MPDLRKDGSFALTVITGSALLILGIAILTSYIVDIRAHRAFVNGGACILFGSILLWWAFSEGKNWGIGFETVTMTVAVVTAVIAILALNVVA
ncbi:MULTISPECIES: hypothetical protein [unclassified Bradyrhizobium]|uniref:hypothetical protein n=1 Tax=Bradyrhizobium sp. USDA 4541 TaxID=2817704 RepID=UPI0020A55701|nr:hypothetical protein [Bradyrhizobium sp. USDA 4541]MCP1846828.1 hypothetical protein [Bradyrhizobium sp. USDA 4541]